MKKHKQYRDNFIDDYDTDKNWGGLEDISHVYAYRDKLVEELLDTIVEPGYTCASDSVFKGKAGMVYTLMQQNIKPEFMEKHSFKNFDEAMLLVLKGTVWWGQPTRKQVTLLHGRLGTIIITSLSRWRAYAQDPNITNEKRNSTNRTIVSTLKEIEEMYKIPFGVHNGFEYGEGCSWGSGMGGFLYGLCLLINNCPDEEVATELRIILERISDYAVQHMKSLAREKPFPTTFLPTSRPRVTSPLLVQTGNNMDTEYILGCAEGFMGILHTLLLVSEVIPVHWLGDVEASIDCVETMMTTTADMPKSIGHDDERESECTFRSGAAAGVLLFCKAAEMFPNKKYLAETAERLGDSCWYRGLLVHPPTKWGKEGPLKLNVYEGLAGVGFAHLRLYTLTRKKIWLHRAQKFALVLQEELGPNPIWPASYETGAKPVDEYHSLGLFDGIGGIICYFTACEKAFLHSEGHNKENADKNADLDGVPLFSYA